MRKYQLLADSVELHFVPLRNSCLLEILFLQLDPCLDPSTFVEG